MSCLHSGVLGPARPRWGLGRNASMKRLLPVLIGLVVLLALVSISFLYYPVHDFIGRGNTVYSPHFTAGRYAQIAVGMPRDKVVELLGAPLATVLLNTNYSPWAERMESLTFSRPKADGDYDSVFVWIGADQKVRWHGRAITD
jgi:hypothetical protein